MPGKSSAHVSPRTSVKTLLATTLVAPLVLLGLSAPGAQAAPKGPGSVTSTHTVKTAPRTVKVNRALAIARAQIGDPYRYGAAGPNAFDCSGLVYYATHRAGFKGVPRTSSAQSSYMRRIPRSAMKPGDFVFVTGSGGVYHVGIFVGRSNGRTYIVHSPRSGAKVRREAVWTNSWFAGTLRGR